ncbi:MAG: hypothetical protein PHT33_13415 [bacterium]|nr:hypothetical protein [bacterium]
MKIAVDKNKGLKFLLPIIAILLLMLSQAAHATLPVVSQDRIYAIQIPGGAQDSDQHHGRVDIKSDGKPYMFQVVLPGNIDHLEGGWACCTDHWAYKVTEYNIVLVSGSPSNMGTLVSENGQPGDNKLLSMVWIPPAVRADFKLYAKGKKRPWGEGGGGGQEYDWNCDWDPITDAAIDVIIDTATTEEVEDSPGAFVAADSALAMTVQLRDQVRLEGNVTLTVSSSAVTVSPMSGQLTPENPSFICTVTGVAPEKDVVITATFGPNGTTDTATVTVFKVELDETTDKYVKPGGDCKIVYNIYPSGFEAELAHFSVLCSNPVELLLAGKSGGQHTYTDWHVKDNQDIPLVPGVYPIMVDVQKEQQISSGAGSIVVVKADIDTDSNNNGTIDPNNSESGTDDPIEENAPGKMVVCSQDTGSFAEVLLDWPPSTGMGECKINLMVTDGNDKIQLWKENKLQQIAWNTEWGIDDPAPDKVYVQGIAPGEAILEMFLRRPDGVAVDSDKIKFTVPGLGTLESDSSEIMSGALDNEEHQTRVYVQVYPATASVKIIFTVDDQSLATVPASLSETEVYTDADGIAETIITSSNTPDVGYSVTVKAKIDGSTDERQLQIALLLPDNEFYEPEDLE